MYGFQNEDFLKTLNGAVVVFHIEYKKGNQRALTNP